MIRTEQAPIETGWCRASRTGPELGSIQAVFPARGGRHENVLENRRRDVRPRARKLFEFEPAEFERPDHRSVRSALDSYVDDRIQSAGCRSPPLERRLLPHPLRVASAPQRGIHRDLYSRWISAADRLSPLHTTGKKRAHRHDAGPTRSQPGLGRTPASAAAGTADAGQTAAAPVK